MTALSSRPAVTSGIDASSIERVRRAARRRPFLERVFTVGELGYSMARRDPYRYLAGRFAAKEACLKALTTAMGKGINLRDIEVVNSAKGMPLLKLHGGAEEALGGRKVFLSIAYSVEFAVAFVVVE